MKILLTGAGGMLGANLWSRLTSSGHDVTGTDLKKPVYVPDDRYRQLDIVHQAQTYQVVSKCNPDLIIHAAAYTDVDGCEKNPDAAYRINGLGTRNLLLGAQRFDAVFLYISTDFVFGNDKKKSYRESDGPCMHTHYARSKYMGEEYVARLSNQFYIVRTSWLFGRNRPNFVSQMIDSLTHKKTYRAVDDMVASPTYSLDLAEAIGRLIEKKTYGTYHLTNAGYASRYDVACEVARILKVHDTSSIQKVTLDELGLAAKRPKQSVLENFMWNLEGYPPMRHWKEAVKHYINELR